MGDRDGRRRMKRWRRQEGRKIGEIKEEERRERGEEKGGSRRRKEEGRKEREKE
mgnify:CR=1 FL=1